MPRPSTGSRAVFFSSPSDFGLCSRFDEDPVSETCSFSIAGCVKITWS